MKEISFTNIKENKEYSAKVKKLYKEFGINAEYLIDHSWGKESCTIAEI